MSRLLQVLSYDIASIGSTYNMDYADDTITFRDITGGVRINLPLANISVSSTKVFYFFDASQIISPIDNVIIDGNGLDIRYGGQTFSEITLQNPGESLHIMFCSDFAGGSYWNVVTDSRFNNKIFTVMYDFIGTVHNGSGASKYCFSIPDYMDGWLLNKVSYTLATPTSAGGTLSCRLLQRGTPIAASGATFVAGDITITSNFSQQVFAGDYFNLDITAVAATFGAGLSCACLFTAG